MKNKPLTVAFCVLLALPLLAVSGGRRGSGGGSGSASLPAQSGPPADPTAGNFVLWFDTDDSQVKVIDSSSNDFTLLRRQNAAPTANSIFRYKNGEAEETPGFTCGDTGQCTMSSLIVSDATYPQTFKFDTVTSTDPANAILCFDFSGTRTTSNCDTGGTSPATDFNRYIPVPLGKPIRFLKMMVSITSFTTIANFSANEKFEFTLINCTGLTVPRIEGNTQVIASGCTYVDKIAFDKLADTSATSYGVGARNYIACPSIPCSGEILIDGGGIPSVAGTTVFSTPAPAGSYWFLGYEQDDPEWTMEADSDGGGPDAGSPGVFAAQGWVQVQEN